MKRSKKHEAEQRELHRSMGATLGFFFLILALIVGFVTVLEYDPVGKVAKQEGYPTQATLVSVEPPLALVFSPTDTEEEERPVTRFDAIAYATPGDTVYGYYHDGLFYPEIAIPHAPRTLSDSTIPVVFLLISIGLISLDPRILYIDMYQS